jgi:hypothetical protein
MPWRWTLAHDEEANRVHAECYVDEHGLPALGVLHERHRVQRLQEYHRWQQSHRRQTN